MVCMLFTAACPTASSREVGTQWTLVKFPAVPIDTDAVFTAADGNKEINFSLDLTGVGVGRYCQSRGCGRKMLSCQPAPPPS